MEPAPQPLKETERLAALAAYDVLDTPPERMFDDLARLAAFVFGVPIAYISLVGEDRQWFKARVGVEAAETPREIAFCARAILEMHGNAMVVPDARADRRFADSPLVTGHPHIRFYAGAPLVTPDGHAVGTLCVADREPHQPTAQQIEVLEALARQVVAQLELRRASRGLAEALERARTLAALVPVCAYCERVRTDDQSWQPVETYLHEAMGTRFSHGICPDCLAKHDSHDAERRR